MVATELKRKDRSPAAIRPLAADLQDPTILKLDDSLSALPHNFRAEFANAPEDLTSTASLGIGYGRPASGELSSAPLYSNVICIPSIAEMPNVSSPGTESKSLLSRFRSPFAAKAVALLTAFGLLGEESEGAWMKSANYNNPTTRQQHFDLGMSYAGTVVYFTWGNNIRGSGVVINPRCILMAAHEFEHAGAFLDPSMEEFYIHTGANYFNNTGNSSRISQVVRHPSRTAPGQGIDSAIAILESDLLGAIPATLAPTPPAANEKVDIIGFGNQGTASVSSWGYIIPTSGDIIGGTDPVTAIDSVTIKTQFVANSSQPLIYNATPGDSGGGLFNSQRQLCGTLSNISPLGNSGSTYSVNLVNIGTWILDTTGPFTPSVEPIAPTLQMQIIAGQITLTVGGAPLSQNGGNWILEISDNLTDWNVASSQFTNNICTMPARTRREFYRLHWVADPQVAPNLLAAQAAQTPRIKAKIKAERKIVLPKTNNLLPTSNREAR